MKYFIGLIILIVIIFTALISNTSSVDVIQVKEKIYEQIVHTQVPYIDKEDANIQVKIKKDKSIIKKKNIPSISPKISVYLQDDTFELKVGMTIVQVDKIWGKPDKVERSYDGYDKEIIWEYGDSWRKLSKLKGVFYYKHVVFKNSKLSYWTKSAYVKIKTHTRDDVVNNHLDEGLMKGMNKMEVYKLWGLPSDSKTSCFNNRKIETRWSFKVKGNSGFSNYVIFENNKVTRWGDF